DPGRGDARDVQTGLTDQVAHLRLGPAQNLAHLVGGEAFHRYEQKRLALDRRQVAQSSPDAPVELASLVPHIFGKGRVHHAPDRVEASEQLEMNILHEFQVFRLGNHRLEAGLHIFVASLLSAGEHARIAAEVRKARYDRVTDIRHEKLYPFASKRGYEDRLCSRPQLQGLYRIPGAAR